MLKVRTNANISESISMSVCSKVYDMMRLVYLSIFYSVVTGVGSPKSDP